MNTSNFYVYQDGVSDIDYAEMMRDNECIEILHLNAYGNDFSDCMLF